MRNYRERMDYNLEEMFYLRMQGWSYTALGARYQKDHSTIVYHCRKHGIVPLVDTRRTVRGTIEPLEHPPKMKAPVEAPKPYIPKPGDKYLHLLEADGPVNPGKSYREYFAEARKRPAEAHYFGLMEEVMPPLPKAPPRPVGRPRREA